MSDFMRMRAELAHRYGRSAPSVVAAADSPPATAQAAGEGFVTEVAGKLILTAPASALTIASDLPAGMQEQWEKASTANPYFQWIQGRFVEAEKANHNGAFWSTGDLQFGEMSVKHGPLNWLHEGRKVVGTIADNTLVHPEPSLEQTAAEATRPYIAAVSAVWKWIYPDEAKVIARASDDRDLYYSMECVSQQMQCVESADSNGCGQAFDYFKAMTDPTSTCSHIRERSATRRMVNPSFLGGAVIVPPTRPGWGEANAEVMRQASHLAEQAGQNAPADTQTSKWELLMASVLAYAVAG